MSVANLETDLEEVKDFPRRAAVAMAELESMIRVAERLSDSGRDPGGLLHTALTQAGSFPGDDYLDYIAESVSAFERFGSDTGAYVWWEQRISNGEGLATIGDNLSPDEMEPVVAFDRRFGVAYPDLMSRLNREREGPRAGSRLRAEIEAAMAELLAEHKGGTDSA